MSVFAVVSLPTYPPGGLEQAINKHYAGRHVKVADGHWLVLDQGGTAQAVSEKLELIGANPSGAVAIVYNIAGYHGRAPTPVWEWLVANFGARS